MLSWFPAALPDCVRELRELRELALALPALLLTLLALWRWLGDGCADRRQRTAAAWLAMLAAGLAWAPAFWLAEDPFAWVCPVLVDAACLQFVYWALTSAPTPGSPYRLLFGMNSLFSFVSAWAVPFPRRLLLSYMALAYSAFMTALLDLGATPALPLWLLGCALLYMFLGDITVLVFGALGSPVWFAWRLWHNP